MGDDVNGEIVEIVYDEFMSYHPTSSFSLSLSLPRSLSLASKSIPFPIHLLFHLHSTLSFRSSSMAAFQMEPGRCKWAAAILSIYNPSSWLINLLIGHKTSPRHKLLPCSQRSLKSEMEGKKDPCNYLRNSYGRWWDGEMVWLSGLFMGGINIETIVMLKMKWLALHQFIAPAVLFTYCLYPGLHRHGSSFFWVERNLRAKQLYARS